MNEQKANQLMKNILEFYQTGRDIRQMDAEGYSTLDIKFAIDSCIQKGFLTGISCSLGCDAVLQVSAYAPYVTPSGLHFIEAN